MIHVETKIKIPFLWGKQVFQKSVWNQVNLIVGPNGSGKTLIAEELAKCFSKAGYITTFLHSERIPESVLFAELEENKTVRNKIESVISNIFGKTIRFEHKTDGTFVPMVQDKNRGVEYNLQNGECHGLKEILTLLVELYRSETKKEKHCLILDEPELHLHPQLQLFFMNEVRKSAELNKNRIFFLITHSPYFIDLRFAEDLTGVVVCHLNRVPTFIDYLTQEDETLFRRFLPRFNTYHKQFFFSDNQIFVEGYTDQQIFTNLLCCLEDRYGMAGSGVIDVGGKDELGVFFKVCGLLGTDGRIITDLDSLFCGKLRDVVCEDERPACWLEKQKEKQLPFYRMLFSKREMELPLTLERLIYKLEGFLVQIGKAVCEINFSISPEIDIFVEKVHALYDKYENPEGLDTLKTVILMGVINLNEKLKDILPIPLALTVPLIINLSNMIFAAFETARVYILPHGCIEHFYTQNTVHYMPVSAKDRLFHTEFEAISDQTPTELKKNYPELVAILTKACARL